MFPRAMGPDRVASVAAFACAGNSYWTSVFPRVCQELGRWRARALAIPDPVLRGIALQALAKRGNMEGAAAFATFAPRVHRQAAVRAAVAFQSAYNYLDTLSEQPTPMPSRNGRRLHQALLVALDLSAPHLDYYAHHDSHRERDDGGYLEALVNACRDALRELPSYPIAAPAARRAAERVVSFQAFNSDPHGEREAIESWAREQTPPGTGLRWWETAASGGSSLGVHVMIASAAEPTLCAEHVDLLERAYFPWIGALHSMLDQLVDTAEDAHTGQRNLIDLYASTEQAAERMSLLAERALACAGALEPAHRHELIVAAMASFYLSAPEAHEGDAAPVSRAVLDVFGPLARPALAVFNTRRAAERVYYACRSHGHHDTAAETFTLAASHR
jgi:tetraprenyl-beta-curcumene synthase